MKKLLVNSATFDDVEESDIFNIFEKGRLKKIKGNLYDILSIHF